MVGRADGDAEGTALGLALGLADGLIECAESMYRLSTFTSISCPAVLIDSPNLLSATACRSLSTNHRVNASISSWLIAKLSSPNPSAAFKIAAAVVATLNTIPTVSVLAK